MEFERARLDIQGSVGIVTLNHAEVMNAVSAEMLGGLMKAPDEVENPKRGLRCLVMTGQGRGFSGGANLQPPAGDSRGGDTSGSSHAGLVLETLSHHLLRRTPH